ncbi:WYL domain-containing protein [Caldicellulosiruptoraceae bacterium PP1]
MNLFVEYKSNMFKAICEIINTAYFSEDKKISKKTISKILNKYKIYNKKYLEMILNKSKDIDQNLYILEEVEEDKFKLSIDSPIIPIVTASEKLWLNSISKSELFRSLLNNEILEYIDNFLKESPDITKNVTYKNNSDANAYESNTSKLDNIREILRAIVERKKISFCYKANNNVEYNNKSAIPLNIEYSIKDDKFYLIAYSNDTDKIIKCSINNITNISILSTIDNFDFYLEEEKEFLENLKAKQPITIAIKDRNNALERALYLFSCFEKRLIYDDENDRYLLEIYYLISEETEIISRILMLGKNVVVISPENIKEEIIRRIKLALSNYDAN